MVGLSSSGPDAYAMALECWTAPRQVQACGRCGRPLDYLVHDYIVCTLTREPTGLLVGELYIARVEGMKKATVIVARLPECVGASIGWVDQALHGSAEMLLRAIGLVRLRG